MALTTRALFSILVMASLALLIISGSNIFSACSTTYEFDVWGRVTKVVDGDTIYMKIYKAYKSKYDYLVGSTVKVRFADINAPELGTIAGEVAKKALTILAEGRYVYLDIDDKYVQDKYGRIVGVLYLPLNKTHVLNVNLWLVLKGYAIVKDYPNEFNPLTWSLYVLLSRESTTPTTTAIKTVTKTFTTTKTVFGTQVRTYTTTATYIKILVTTKTNTITLTKSATITKTTRSIITRTVIKNRNKY